MPDNSTTLVSRRWVLHLASSTAAFALGPVCTASAQPVIPDDLQARFLRWSRMATGFAELPPSTARECLELIVRSGTTLANLADLEPGAYRGTALEKRLLEAWYTGVFKLEMSSDTRNEQTTLMWRVAGIDPPPSWCRNGPQSWASAPPDL